MKEWYAAVSGRSDMSEYLVLCPPVGPGQGLPPPLGKPASQILLKDFKTRENVERFCKRQLKGVSKTFINQPYQKRHMDWVH